MDHFYFCQMDHITQSFLGILSNTHHALLLQPLSTYNVIKELPTNTFNSKHMNQILSQLL